MIRGTLLACLLLLGSCVAPTDVFRIAENSLLAQDLPGALVALDTVPVSHKRYPEARAAALSVERRMRRGHELLLEALLLRAEWRDSEALAVLRQASTIWPRMPSVDELIKATQHRVQLLRATGDSLAGTESPVVVPVSPQPVPAAPAGEVQPPTNPIQETRTVTGPTASGEDPVAIGLVAVESRLGRGELEGAVADLIELSRHYPKDTRVRLRLARVLHQRALQRYAHGQLSAAIVDWERVVVLDPNNGVANDLLLAARAEAGSDVRRL